MSTSSLDKFEDQLCCMICKELLNVPETTPCGHTFCNLCIRRHISGESKCPVCRADVFAGSLRSNPFAQDIVESWQKLRPELDRLVTGNTEDDFSKSCVPTQEIEEVVPSSSPEESNGMARCPICNQKMPIEEIERSHLSQCLGNPGSLRVKKTPAKKVMVNYHMLSDKALRDLLVKEGLSKTGSRPRLEKRHLEFLLQWNANAASKNPVGRSEILRRMQQWEQAEDSLQHTKSVKELDSQKWVEDHHSEFNVLKANAFRQLGRDGPRKRTLADIEASMGDSMPEDAAAKKQDKKSKS